MPSNLPFLPRRRAAIGVCSSLVRCAEQLVVDRASAQQRPHQAWFSPIFADNHSQVPQPLVGPYLFRTFVSAAVAVASNTLSQDDAAVEATHPSHVTPTRLPSILENRRRGRRGQKRSAPLENALLEIGNELYAILPRPRSIDLSYFNPRYPIDRKEYQTRVAVVAKSELTDVVSLQSILGRCISYAHRSGLQEVPREYFSPEELQFLHYKGWNIVDVYKWACIVLCADSTKAIKSLVNLQKPPGFLILFMLRRQLITRQGFTAMLNYLDDALRPGASTSQYGSTDPTEPHGSHQIFKHIDTVFVIIVRLLRHARRVHPEAVEEISAFAIKAFESLVPPESDHSIEAASKEQISRLTFYANKILTLIAISPQAKPLASASRQEIAQFDLIKFMNSRNPPLPITREGYNALISVQLAHPKTPDERLWALLKANSWPPWKEDKTGMDANITPDHGVSRAGSVINWMEEAGHPRGTWENIAKIYSGWDTDGSPTIQTRYISARFGLKGTFPMKKPRDERRRQLVAARQVWAARIRATRTLREAWACFLASHRAGMRACHDICFAMCEKLVAGYPRGIVDDSGRDERSVLPGDGKEVYEEPLSPYEQTYVESTPPSVGKFVMDMIAKSVRPRGRFLELLLRHIDYIPLGVHVLKHSNPPELGKTLLGLFQAEHSPLNASKVVSPYIFTAYIAFLCNNANSTPETWQLLNPGGNTDSLNTSTRASFGIGPRHYKIAQIVNLLLTQRPRYIPPYNTMLKRFVVGSPLCSISGTERLVYLNSLESFKLMRRIVGAMEDAGLDIDEQALQSICAILFQTALTQRDGGDLIADTKSFSHQATAYIRTLFQKVVGSRENVISVTTVEQRQSAKSESQLPLTIPGPSPLHYYVRALGAFNDFEGLYSVACFLSDAGPELLKAAQYDTRLKTRLRKVLIALRVFLERSWANANGDSSKDQAPQEIIYLARQKVESLGPTFGGWPTDDEVDMYCDRKPMKQLRGNKNSTKPSK